MIGTYNIEKNMVHKISDIMDVYEFSTDDVEFPEIDGILIDYISKDNYKEWVYQAALIEKYVKKTKTIIFDRYLSITNKEFDWLKKFNVTFFEPAINNRRDFQYLPYWVDNIEIDWSYDIKKSIHLAYTHNNMEDRLKYFEKYYKQYAMLFPDKKVCYSSNILNEKKVKDYENNNMIFYKSIDYSNVLYSISIDNKKNYEIGYLDESVFKALKCGCVPLLPSEHKYFHALFGNLVVDSIEDIDYLTSTPDLNCVFIEDILKNLNTLYPEFLIDNVAKVLINCLKE